MSVQITIPLQISLLCFSFLQLWYLLWNTDKYKHKIMKIRVSWEGQPTAQVRTGCQEPTFSFSFLCFLFSQYSSFLLRFIPMQWYEWILIVSLVQAGFQLTDSNQKAASLIKPEVLFDIRIKRTSHQDLYWRQSTTGQILHLNSTFKN